jgi:4-hydroxybutyryl-CoA dehydratase/vinylacetyl-CoA-Delta-isomerase
MHGAGSPQAQRIMIARQGNLAQKKEGAKVIAGIPPTAKDGDKKASAPTVANTKSSTPAQAGKKRELADVH